MRGNRERDLQETEICCVPTWLVFVAATRSRPFLSDGFAEKLYEGPRHPTSEEGHPPPSDFNDGSGHFSNF